MIALAASLLFLAAPAKIAPKPDPIAVIPFKNLNSEATLDWMRAGIAETMISDLKKSGKARVVERDQVDHALLEIEMQGAHDTEESTAAKVGKLVGAKTIVVGSFQKAEKQLRINARFVSVETGEVLDAAKTTGAASDPFALQDRIVAQLLGVPPGAPALPKRKPATPKTVEAYRLYAMSLTVASDAERFGYLKQSLAQDPDFVYSADDLLALKKRMGVYDEASKEKVGQAESGMLAQALDPRNAPEDRARAADDVLTLLQQHRRYHTLVDFAEKIINAQVPPLHTKDEQEFASYEKAFALDQLKMRDKLLQWGERHLKKYPGGPYYQAVEFMMKMSIDQRETWAKRRAEYQKDLDDELANYAQKPQPLSGADLLGRDWSYCIATIWNSEENELMVDNCGKFIEQHEKDSDAEALDRVKSAKLAVIRALASTGKFEEARAKVKAWDLTLDADPVMRAWPTD